MSSFVVAGAALTAAGLAGRMLLRQASKVSYYRGGFEPKMTRREANLILNLSTSSSVDKVKQAHKRIIILNHPDKGGSPYLAAKINEAKSVLTKEPRQISFNSNVHDRIHRYLKKSVHILHNYLLLSEWKI